jgi:threonine dehydratase
MRQAAGNIGLADILAARDRIAGIVVRTPVVPGHTFAGSARTTLLKLENRQPAGSFKIRGAANAIRHYLERGAPAGVVTASTGNHARAVGYVGRRHHLDVRAFVSRDVPPARVGLLRREGVTVDTTGRDQAEALNRARQYAAEHGYVFIPPFDDPAVISGQGTVGLELLEDAPGLDLVAVPVSGGGLAAGVGVAVKALHPATRVVGVCGERTPAMRASLDAGHPVTVPEEDTVADSLRGDLGPDNRYTFGLVREHLDEVVIVSEQAIIDTMRLLEQHDQLRVEGAAAAAAAYLRQLPPGPAGTVVAAVITGGDPGPAGLSTTC